MNANLHDKFHSLLEKIERQEELLRALLQKFNSRIQVNQEFIEHVNPSTHSSLFHSQVQNFIHSDIENFPPKFSSNKRSSKTHKIV